MGGLFLATIQSCSQGWDPHFFGKMRTCIKFYKEFCIRKAKKQRLVKTKF
jgi:hypothetical protein